MEQDFITLYIAYIPGSILQSDGSASATPTPEGCPDQPSKGSHNVGQKGVPQDPHSQSEPLEETSSFRRPVLNKSMFPNMNK